MCYIKWIACICLKLIESDANTVQNKILNSPKLKYSEVLHSFTFQAKNKPTNMRLWTTWKAHKQCLSNTSHSPECVAHNWRNSPTAIQDKYNTKTNHSPHVFHTIGGICRRQYRTICQRQKTIMRCIAALQLNITRRASLYAIMHCNYDQLWT